MFVKLIGHCKVSKLLHEPIAIVGLACRLPGATDPDALWDMMMSGTQAWGPVAEDRLDRRLYLDRGPQRRGQTYTDLAGLMPDLEADLAYLPGKRKDLERYDIAHQIFLLETCRALRDAGLDPSNLPSAQRCGVYVGHTGGSNRIGDLVYSTGIEQASRLLQQTSLVGRIGSDATDRLAMDLTRQVRSRYGVRNADGNEALGASDCAGIIQEALEVRGPTAVFDAACASGLQALAVAVRALRARRIEYAIVGAVSHFKSDNLVLFSAAQSVSRTGSFPLCEDADGLVTSEGQVSLVLKPLSAAVRDGNRIRAVIDGIGMSSDGRGKSLWAPRSDGQLLAMQRAYPDPQLIRAIGYVEAHATGTQVGDATEIEALELLLRPHLSAGERVPIGSLKTNVGHTLETAGLASLVKVILAMERGMIPPGVSNRALNPTLIKSDCLVAVDAAMAWPEKLPDGARQGAVNAFGIGGINVHVVVSSGGSLASISEATPHKIQSISIVASECILPGSREKDSFLTLMARGKSALIEVPPDRWSAAKDIGSLPRKPFKSLLRMGGFISDYSFDWRKFKIPPVQVASANPLQFMIIEAVERALRSVDQLDRRSTAVIVGTSFGGDFSNDLQIGLRLPETSSFLRPLLGKAGLNPAASDAVLDEYQDVLLARYPALLDETGSFTASTLATRVSKVFNLNGGAFSLDSGRHSVAIGLATAQDMLSEGLCETVICAFAQRQMDFFAYEGLSLQLARCSEYGGSKLDPQRLDLFVPGEGVVVLVVKRDGARVIGPVINSIKMEVLSTAEKNDAPATAMQPLIGNLGAADAAVSFLHSAENVPSSIRTVERGMTSEILIDKAKFVGRGKTAALFPGQGSQYEDCFRSMVAQSKIAASAMDDVDQLANCMQLPTLAETAWRRDHEMGRSIWATQWAVFLSDLFAWRLLQRFGVEPDYLASHSFGEFPMSVAAGMITFRQGVNLVRARAESLEQHGGSNGGLLSMLADAAAVQDLLAMAGDDLWLSALNAPRQTVAGGTLEALDRLEAICADRRIACKRLAVGSAFHTPLLLQAALAFAPAVERTEFRNTSYRLYSATTGGPVTDADGLRNNLILQFTTPVSWVETVKRLYEDGVRTFIEVGPSTALSTLVRQVLKDAPDVTVIPMDQIVKDPVSDACEVLRGKFSSAGLIPTQSSAGRASKRPPGGIEKFDASCLRRQKNRERSLGGMPFGTVNPTPLDQNQRASQPSARSQSSSALRVSITEFVMEHTGYPLDMIDFRVDLEADLGIDSIRKAQLIAELGQRFGIKREKGISLSDFLTLGDVENFFASRLKVSQDISSGSAAGLRSGSVKQSSFDMVVSSIEAGGPSGVLLSFDRSIVTKLTTGTSGQRRYWGIRQDGIIVAGWNEAGLFLIEDIFPAKAADGFRRARVGVDKSIEELLGECSGISEIPDAGRNHSREVFAFDLAEASRPITSWDDAEPYTAAAKLGQDELGTDWGKVLLKLLTDSAAGEAARRQLSTAGRWLAFGRIGSNLNFCAGDSLTPEWAKPDLGIVPSESDDEEVSAQLTQRYVLRLQEAPRSPAEAQSICCDRIAVIGKGVIAETILRSLNRPEIPTYQPTMAEPESPETIILAEPAFLSKGGPLPFDDEDKAMPRLLGDLQAWLAPLERGQPVRRRLLALVDLGGTLGTGGERFNPCAAALLGLLKGLAQEYEGLWLRVVDIGGVDWSEACAAQVIGELDDATEHWEVALTYGGRKVLGLGYCPIVRAPAAVETPSGVWLATGGASGITAECMFALAQRYRLKVALVGRTVLDHSEPQYTDKAEKKRAVSRREQITELLSRYEAEGLQAHYFACDLGDPKAVARLIEDVEDQCGPITALLHGAGIEESSRFSKKSAKSFRDALLPKAAALEFIIRALSTPGRQQRLQTVIAFGSTSGQFGGHGQADYSMANQLLARQVAALRSNMPGLKATCFHWHAWAETGMAARSGIQILLEQFGISLMPVKEGIFHFIAELEAGLPESEVVITEPALMQANRRRFPDFQLYRMANKLISSPPADSTGVHVVLDPSSQPFLSDHKLAGVPLLPGAMAIELLFQAAEHEKQQRGNLLLSDFTILRPISVLIGNTITLAITPVSEDAGMALRELGAQEMSVVGKIGYETISHVTALKPEAAPFPLYPSVYFDDAELVHGPTLRSLKGSYFERDGGWAELEAPDPHDVIGEQSTVRICSPVALVDGCFYACGMFAYFLCGRRIERPLGIARMIIGRVPEKGEICRFRFKLVEQQSTYSIYDFTLFDAAGDLVIDGRGLKMGRFS